MEGDFLVGQGAQKENWELKLRETTAHLRAKLRNLPPSSSEKQEKITFE
jgi:hypothetical protein